jgi:hypothetical protein
VGLLHPQFGGGLVHLAKEDVDAACLVDGQHHGDVVGGGEHQRLQGLPLAQNLAGFHGHHRLIGVEPPVEVFDVSLGDLHREAFLAGLERVFSQHEIGGHHLGDAGDRHGGLGARAGDGAEPVDRHRRLPFARPREAGGKTGGRGLRGPVGRRRPLPVDPEPGDPEGDQKESEDHAFGEPVVVQGRHVVRNASVGVRRAARIAG